MDAIANIKIVFIFVFCILFVNIDITVLCVSVKSIKVLVFKKIRLVSSSLGIGQEGAWAAIMQNTPPA